MKSSIKIDFIDRGTGVGIEPVIRVQLIKSEDPRDTLIAVLFESVQNGKFLQFQYGPPQENFQLEIAKQILIFKPEAVTEYPAPTLQN